jgi:thiamine biosynthesis protein ThiS
MTAVNVVINGDPAEVEEGISVAALLEHLRVEPRRVVVEHNRRILRSEELAGARVAAGDELELVHLVGGG